MAIEIEVKSNSRQARADLNRLNRSVDNISESANKLSSQFSKLVTVSVAAFAAVGSVRAVTNITDSYRRLESRIALTNTGLKEQVIAFNALNQIAIRTRSNQESLADLYSRIGRATKRLGIEQETVIQVTENIAKSITISGASAESANAAIVQLGQGLAAGALRGQELNSVMEQTPAVAQAIARGLGVTIGELRAFANEGKLSAEVVVEALRGQTAQIDAEFKSVVPTFAQGLVVLGTGIGRVINELDQLFGLTTFFTDSALSLGNTLNNVAVPFANYLRSFKQTNDVAESIKTVFSSLGGLISQVGTLIRAAFERLAPASFIGTLGAISKIFEKAFIDSSVNAVSALTRLSMTINKVTRFLQVLTAKVQRTFLGRQYVAGVKLFAGTFAGLSLNIRKVTRDFSIFNILLKAKVLGTFRDFTTSIKTLAIDLLRGVGGITTVFSDLIEGIVDKTRDLLKGSSVVSKFLDKVVGGFKDAYVAIIGNSYWTDTIEGVISLSRKLISGSGLKHIKRFCKLVKDFFYDVYDAVIGNSYWTDTVKGVIEGSKDILVEGVRYISRFADKVKSIFSDIKDSISGVFGGKSTAEKLLFPEINISLTNSNAAIVDSIFESITDGFYMAVDWVRKQIGYYTSSIVLGAATAVSANILKGLKYLASTGVFLAITVTDALLKEFGSSLVELLAAVAFELGRAVGLFFTDAITNLILALPSLYEIASDFGAGLVRGVTDAIPLIGDALYAAFAVLDTLLLGTLGAAVTSLIGVGIFNNKKGDDKKKKKKDDDEDILKESAIYAAMDRVSEVVQNAFGKLVTYLQASALGQVIISGLVNYKDGILSAARDISGRTRTYFASLFLYMKDLSTAGVGGFAILRTTILTLVADAGGALKTLFTAVYTSTFAPILGGLNSLFAMLSAQMAIILGKMRTFITLKAIQLGQLSKEIIGQRAYVALLALRAKAEAVSLLFGRKLGRVFGIVLRFGKAILRSLTGWVGAAVAVLAVLGSLFTSGNAEAAVESYENLNKELIDVETNSIHAKNALANSFGVGGVDFYISVKAEPKTVEETFASIEKANKDMLYSLRRANENGSSFDFLDDAVTSTRIAAIDIGAALGNAAIAGFNGFKGLGNKLFGTDFVATAKLNINAVENLLAAIDPTIFVKLKINPKDLEEFTSKELRGKLAAASETVALRQEELTRATTGVTSFLVSKEQVQELEKLLEEAKNQRDAIIAVIDSDVKLGKSLKSVFKLLEDPKVNLEDLNNLFGEGLIEPLDNLDVARLLPELRKDYENLLAEGANLYGQLTDVLTGKGTREEKLNAIGPILNQIDQLQESINNVGVIKLKVSDIELAKNLGADDTLLNLVKPEELKQLADLQKEILATTAIRDKAKSGDSQEALEEADKKLVTLGANARKLLEKLATSYGEKLTKAIVQTQYDLAKGLGFSDVFSLDEETLKSASALQQQILDKEKEIAEARKRTDVGAEAIVTNLQNELNNLQLQGKDLVSDYVDSLKTNFEKLAENLQLSGASISFADYIKLPKDLQTELEGYGKAATALTERIKTATDSGQLQLAENLRAALVLMGEDAEEIVSKFLDTTKVKPPKELDNFEKALKPFEDIGSSFNTDDFRELGKTFSSEMLARAKELSDERKKLADKAFKSDEDRLNAIANFNKKIYDFEEQIRKKREDALLAETRSKELGKGFSDVVMRALEGEESFGTGVANLIFDSINQGLMDQVAAFAEGFMNALFGSLENAEGFGGAFANMLLGPNNADKDSLASKGGGFFNSLFGGADVSTDDGTVQESAATGVANEQLLSFTESLKNGVSGMGQWISTTVQNIAQFLGLTTATTAQTATATAATTVTGTLAGAFTALIGTTTALGAAMATAAASAGASSGISLAGSFGSFADGGITPRGGPMMLHPNEMILNQRQQKHLFEQVNQGRAQATNQQAISINVTGDISRQTKKEIYNMLPTIAGGVNQFNKEQNR